MPAVAAGTLLAVDGSAGTPTLTVTVAATPAAAEFILMFFLAYNATGLTPLGPSAISDSRGGTWVTNSLSDGAVGYARSQGLELGSVARTAGPALIVGDTITVTWDPAAGYPPAHTAVICRGFSTLGVAKKQRFIDGGFCGLEYGNNQNYPDGDGTPTTLLWGGRSISLEPIPCSGANVSCISVAGGIGGASGWTPADAEIVIETTQPGGLYLAVAWRSVVLDGQRYQPGGHFTTPGSIVIANYQLLSPVKIVPSGVFATPHPFKGR